MRKSIRVQGQSRLQRNQPYPTHSEKEQRRKETLAFNSLDLE